MTTIRNMEIISVGFGNFVMKNRIVAVIKVGSIPIKKIKEEADKNGKCIDVTGGRKTKSIIFSDSGDIILSALSTDTIRDRINN